MKAQLVESRPPGDWIYEIKFDGYRALALRGGSETRVLSRNQNDLGKKFTNIRDSIAALDVQDAIIDYAASGIMLCRIPFYAAPSTESPLTRHSPMRHKKVRLAVLVRVP
jgi:ATP-dependent DNA ligase